MPHTAADLVRLVSEVLDFVQSICPDKDGIATIKPEQFERLEYFETEIAVSSEDAGISIPDVERPKTGKSLGCIQLPYYDDLAGIDIMPTRSWYRAMEKLKRLAENRLHRYASESETVAAGIHARRMHNETSENTETFLANRIRKARLEIIGQFRDTRSNQGLSRRKLIEDLRGKGYARQDILDAIGELFRQGYLQTVGAWREQVNRENEGLTDSEGRQIIMTRNQMIKSLGLSRLHDNDLVLVGAQPSAPDVETAGLTRATPDDSNGGVETDTRSVLNLAISKGEERFRLTADDTSPFIVPSDYQELFRLFAAKVAHGLSGECVGYRLLNSVAISEQSVDPKHTETASDELRVAISKLNKDLASWHIAPDDGHWIKNRRGEGYFLNSSIDWTIDDENLRLELTRYSQSVWSTNIDCGTLAKNTPDQNQRLPSQPRRDVTRDEDAE